MSKKKSEVQKRHFNSTQLNIVTVVDVLKANINQSTKGCLYSMDNNTNSIGQGTENLQTICKQGQVLNWIIYAMDADKRLDGIWPPSIRINNIVFLSEDGEDVCDIKVCSDMRVYGGPDKIRSKYTPVYYYWAGTVLHELPVGEYKYRLILEVEAEKTKKVSYLNHDNLSLRVISINESEEATLLKV